MEVAIVGKKPYSFTDRQSGRKVEGCSFYYEYADRHIEGIGVGSFSLSSDKLAKLENPMIGANVRLYFNRYQKVDFIQVLPEGK